MIEIRTLGTLDLRDRDGREPRSILSRTKRVALLTYLALATPRGFHRRDTLLALFWPELDQDRARRALRQALYVVRKAATDGALLSRGDEEVALDWDLIWCDAAVFDELLDERRLKEALELYKGDLLEGFHLSGCLEFERWLAAERARLKRRAAEAAWSLAEEARDDGAAVEAASWARRAASLSPGDEGTVRRVIELLDQLGDRAGAIQEYEAFAERLREDYDAEPAPETRGLMDAVLAREGSNGGVVLSESGTEKGFPAGAEIAAAAARPVRSPSRNWRNWAIGAVGLTAVSVIAGAIVLRGGSDAELLDPTRVLIDVFENETGDPELDRLGLLAADWITQGLTYAGFVDVLSLGTPLLSEQAVAVEPGSPPNAARLQALAESRGTGTVVSGRYYLHDSEVQLQAQITDANSGEVLATLEPVAASIGAPADALEQLRDRVMTSLATLTDPRLAKWARYASKPPTFEAYQEFIAGLELYATQQNNEEAIPHLLRAAELDSSFTMPLLWAVQAYRTTRFWVGRAKGDTIAWELNQRRERLAPLDRHFLDYHLAGIRADHMESFLAMRRLVELAPSSGFLMLAGDAAIAVNRPREALSYLEAADPESGWLRGQSQYWGYLTASYHLLGDHEREIEAARRGARQYPNNIRTLRHEVRALAALGRADEASALIEQGLSLSGNVGSLFYWMHRELRAHGHRAEASRLLERAIKWYKDRPWYRGFPNESGRMREASERFQLSNALADAGRFEESEAVLEPVLAMYPDNPPAPFALLLARQGKREEAMRITRQVEEAGRSAGYRDETRPGTTLFRAAIAAALGDRQRAIELLQQAVAEGIRFDTALHTRSDFEVLWDDPAFQELLRPKG